jgi:hypothetical protein
MTPDRSRRPAGPTPLALAVMARVVLRRPGLWWTALGALRRLAAPGWWRDRPHLPLPDGRLWAFRMVTAYGRPDRAPDAADVISYLEWCRSTAHPKRRASGRLTHDVASGRLGPTRSG